MKVKCEKNGNEREKKTGSGEKSLERNGANKWKMRRKKQGRRRNLSARGRSLEKIFKKKREALNFENEGARTAEEKD